MKKKYPLFWVILVVSLFFTTSAMAGTPVLVDSFNHGGFGFIKGTLPLGYTPVLPTPQQRAPETTYLSAGQCKISSRWKSNLELHRSLDFMSLGPVMIEVTATVTGAAELLIRIVDGGFPERQYSLRQLATSTSTTLRLEGVVLSPYAQLQLLIHNPSHLWGEVLLDSITYNSGISQHSKGN